MAVKFLIAHTVGALFNAGEIAGFSKEVEKDLIDRKIAEAHKGTAPKADVPPPPPFEPRQVASGTWTVFAGKKVIREGFADQNAAEEWILEQTKG